MIKITEKRLNRPDSIRNNYICFIFLYYVKIKDNGTGNESNWKQLTDEMTKIIKAGRISENCDILVAAWVALFVQSRTAVLEVEGSSPRSDQHLSS